MGAGSQAVRVLLVDDNADVAEVTAMHLERQDEQFDVEVRTGAADALEALDDTVDCIVSDYEMPGRDGLDLLRAVREEYPTLPFVLFTGRGNEEIASEAISAGVTDYLQKGTSNEQYAVLANRVRNAVEHRRTEASAESTESRYRALVESLPHAVLVHDGDSLLYGNERLAELLGANDFAEIEGQSPISFVHPPDRDRVADRVTSVLEDRESIEWAEFRIETLDGEVRWVETTAVPVEYEGAPVSQVVLRDVTDRRQHERRLERLHEATAELFDAEGDREVAQVAVRTVVDVLDEPVVVVWRSDHDTGELHPLGASDRAREVAVREGFDPGVSPLPPDTLEVATAEAGEPRVVDDYADREDTPSDAFETMLMHPLGDHGLITVGSEEPRSFSESERDLMGILARSVSAGLELSE